MLPMSSYFMQQLIEQRLGMAPTCARAPGILGTSREAGTGRGQWLGRGRRWLEGLSLPGGYSGKAVSVSY